MGTIPAFGALCMPKCVFTRLVSFCFPSGFPPEPVSGPCLKLLALLLESPFALCSHATEHVRCHQA